MYYHYENNLTKLVEMSNRSLFSPIFYLYDISDPDHIVREEVIAELTCILYFILWDYNSGHLKGFLLTVSKTDLFNTP